MPQAFCVSDGHGDGDCVEHHVLVLVCDVLGGVPVFGDVRGLGVLYAV